MQGLGLMDHSHRLHCRLRSLILLFTFTAASGELGIAMEFNTDATVALDGYDGWQQIEGRVMNIHDGSLNMEFRSAAMRPNIDIVVDNSIQYDLKYRSDHYDGPEYGLVVRPVNEGQTFFGPGCGVHTTTKSALRAGWMEAQEFQGDWDRGGFSAGLLDSTHDLYVPEGRWLRFKCMIDVESSTGTIEIFDLDYNVTVGTVPTTPLDLTMSPGGELPAAKQMLLDHLTGLYVAGSGWYTHLDNILHQPPVPEVDL